MKKIASPICYFFFFLPPPPPPPEKSQIVFEEQLIEDRLFPKIQTFEFSSYQNSKIRFSLQEFVQFKGHKRNHSQLKKTKKFLYNLQKNQKMIQQFSETSFRSFLAFPAFSMQKKEKGIFGWFLFQWRKNLTGIFISIRLAFHWNFQSLKESKTKKSKQS